MIRRHGQLSRSGAVSGATKAGVSVVAHAVDALRAVALAGPMLPPTSAAVRFSHSTASSQLQPTASSAFAAPRPVVSLAACARARVASKSVSSSALLQLERTLATLSSTTLTGSALAAQTRVLSAFARLPVTAVTLGNGARSSKSVRNSGAQFLQPAHVRAFSSDATNKNNNTEKPNDSADKDKAASGASSDANKADASKDGKDGAAGAGSEGEGKGEGEGAGENQDKKKKKKEKKKKAAEEEEEEVAQVDIEAAMKKSRRGNSFRILRNLFTFLRKLIAYYRSGLLQAVSMTVGAVLVFKGLQLLYMYASAATGRLSTRIARGDETCLPAVAAVAEYMASSEPFARWVVAVWGIDFFAGLMAADHMTDYVHTAAGAHLLKALAQYGFFIDQVKNWEDEWGCVFDRLDAADPEIRIMTMELINTLLGSDDMLEYFDHGWVLGLLTYRGRFLATVPEHLREEHPSAETIQQIMRDLPDRNLVFDGLIIDFIKKYSLRRPNFLLDTVEYLEPTMTRAIAAHMYNEGMKMYRDDDNNVTVYGFALLAPAFTIIQREEQSAALLESWAEHGASPKNLAGEPGSSFVERIEQQGLGLLLLPGKYDLLMKNKASHPGWAYEVACALVNGSDFGAKNYTPAQLAREQAIHARRKAKKDAEAAATEIAVAVANAEAAAVAGEAAADASASAPSVTVGLVDASTVDVASELTAVGRAAVAATVDAKAAADALAPGPSPRRPRGIAVKEAELLLTRAADAIIAYHRTHGPTLLEQASAGVAPHKATLDRLRVSTVTTALKPAPKEFEVMSMLTDLLLRRGDLEGARKYSDELMLLQHQRPQPYVLAARVAEAAGDAGRAEELLRKAMDKDANHIAAAGALARLYARTGKHNAAIEVAKVVLSRPDAVSRAQKEAMPAARREHEIAGWENLYHRDLSAIAISPLWETAPEAQGVADAALALMTVGALRHEPQLKVAGGEVLRMLDPAIGSGRAVASVRSGIAFDGEGNFSLNPKRVREAIAQFDAKARDAPAKGYYFEKHEAALKERAAATEEERARLVAASLEERQERVAMARTLVRQQQQLKQQQQQQQGAAAVVSVVDSSVSSFLGSNRGVNTNNNDREAE